MEHLEHNIVGILYALKGTVESHLALAEEESAFLAHHADYDRSYTATRLSQFVGTAAAGAAVVHRYARVVAVMTGFLERLRGERLATPFPAAELARAWSACAT